MNWSKEKTMDVKHEMREALMAYAVKVTGVTREEIEESMTEEDHEDVADMVTVVTEVAERYAQECVNKTAAELI
jgi:predicted house-cleaning noncanonical NTP pyrophosphatase (MazG superfamily)